jgi:hypothetical protein
LCFTTFAQATIALALASCSRHSDAPAAQTPTTETIVEIPKVNENQTKTDKDTPVPTAEREVNPANEPDFAGEGGYNPEDPWASMGSGARGGPDCDKAADCCIKFYTQTSHDPSVQRMCAQMRHAPTSVCQSIYSSFKSAAPTLGIQCN